MTRAAQPPPPSPPINRVTTSLPQSHVSLPHDWVMRPPVAEVTPQQTRGQTQGRGQLRHRTPEPRDDNLREEGPLLLLFFRRHTIHEIREHLSPRDGAKREETPRGRNRGNGTRGKRAKGREVISRHCLAEESGHNSGAGARCSRDGLGLHSQNASRTPSPAPLAT